MTNHIFIHLLKNRMALMVSFWVMMVLGLSSGYAQDPAQTFLIDLGSSSTPTAGNWNNVTTSQNDGASVNNLMDTDGLVSAINFVVIDDADNGFGGGNGYNTEGYDGIALGYPQSACSDSYFAHGAGGVYQLTGLDLDRLYTLKLFGSRAASSGGRVASFTINGVAQQQDGLNNNTLQTVFENISPDTNGTITIDFNVASGSSFGYLNVLELVQEAVPNIQAPVLFTASLSGTLEATLTWDDKALNEDGYRIVRSVLGTDITSQINLPANNTQYIDTDIEYQATYIYRLYAYNANDSSAEATTTLTVGVDPNGPPESAFTYFIDLGNPANPTAGNWNNVTLEQEDGVSIQNLINAAGGSSDINFVVVREADYDYGGGSGYNVDGPDNSSLGYPATATTDSYFAFGPGGAYQLTGLQSYMTYTIKLYGSRVSTTNDREASFTIGGVTKTLQGANNVDNFVVFDQLQADATGTITLDFNVASGSTFAYLNVLELTERGTLPVLPPSNLTAALTNLNEVILNWTDESGNETGFRIERSIRGTDIKDIIQLPANTTQYVDTNLEYNAFYEYKVYSHTGIHESAILQTTIETDPDPNGPAETITTYLIDLGDPSIPTSGNWNNVTGDQDDGTTIEHLIDANGINSAINLTILDDADNGYASGGGYNAQGYNGSVAGYPQTACIDSYFANGKAGIYQLSGLQSYMHYTLKLFGSRAASSGRTARFTVNGVTHTLDGEYNSTNFAIFQEVRADQNGNITMEFGVDDGSNFGYLNVVELIERGHPPLLHPDALTASVQNIRIGHLTWQDNANNETGYRIERISENDGDTTFINLPPNTTTYIDEDLDFNTTYHYTVYGYTNIHHSKPVFASLTTQVDPIALPEDTFTYLIDLGDPATPTEGFWNNMTVDQTSGASLGSLINNTGGLSDISFTVLTPAHNNYQGGNGINTAGHNGTALGYPASAASDSYFANGPGGVYQLSGLKSHMNYTLKMFGSRAAPSGGRVARFTINGETQFLDGQNNDDAVALFENLQADGNGNITLNFEVASGSNFGYLNVLEIIENGNPVILAPDSLELTWQTDRQVVLNWDDNSDNESGFEVLRKLNYGSYESVAVLPADITSYSEVLPGAGFHVEYQVKAYNQADQTFSNAVLLSTEAAVTPPNPVENLTATIEPDQITLNWEDDYRIVIIGSSSAAGIGASSPQNSWAGLLTSWIEALHPQGEVINLAVPGFTTRDVRSNGSAPAPDTDHNIDAAISFNPDMIIVNLPSNNVAEGISQSETLAHYQELKQRAMESGIKFFVTTTQPRNMASAERNLLKDEALAILTEFEDEAINVYDELADATNDYRIKTIYNSGDGIHVNDAGHLYLFETVRDGIIQYVDAQVIIRKSIDNHTFYNVANLLAGSSSYVDNELISDVNFYYEVLKANRDGESSNRTIEVIRGQGVTLDTATTHKPMYNGKITAMRWKNSIFKEERSYNYRYDPMNRMKSAIYATKAGTGWQTSQRSYNTGYLYDLNGNIQLLNRNGAHDSNQKVIDQLAYTYEGNKLLSISDLTKSSKGFTDGNAAGDHSYDANGNATKDLNNGIADITYNYLNLPEVVTRSNGTYVKYIYDAKGVKLAQETYDANNVLQGTAVFAGQFVYEDDALKSIQHTDGQVVPDKIDGGWEYQYDLKDHVGNTRVTFTSKPKTLDFDASFESENAINEEALYYNIAETRVTFNSADANSDGGNEVTRVNVLQSMGPGIALFVTPGDTIDAQVYGYYEGGSGYSAQSGLNTMIAAVAGGFGGATGTSATEAQQAVYNAFDNALSGMGVLGTSDDHVPAAYLNYILFDEDMVMYQNGFLQISAAANGSHELMALENISVEKEGLAYVWVSNESAVNNWVYFDDMSVTIHEGAVIQQQDYYPHGLSFNGYKRYEPEYEGSYNNRSLDWKDLGFRQYDKATGRFFVVDPLAELQLGESPYQYAGNDPVNNIDALGLIKWPKFLLKTGAALINTFTRKTATVRSRNGKSIVEVKGGGRSEKKKRGGNSRSKKKKDKQKDKGGNESDNNNNGKGNNTNGGSSDNDRSSESSDSEESESDPFEDFKKKTSAFGPDFLNRNTSVGLEPNRRPRFELTPLKRKEAEASDSQNDNPTELGKWHTKAQNATDRQKLKEELYRNLKYNEARALESLTQLNLDNDPKTMGLKKRLEALALNSAFDDEDITNEISRMLDTATMQVRSIGLESKNYGFKLKVKTNFQELRKKWEEEFETIEHKVIIIIRDKNGNAIAELRQDVEEGADEDVEITWDGTKDNGDKIKRDEGPFTAQVRAEGNYRKDDGRETTIRQDLDEEIEFEIDRTWESWAGFEYHWVQPGANYDHYREDESYYIDGLNITRNKETTIPEKDPLKSLNEDLTEREFLGEEHLYHKRFYYLVKQAKDKLKEDPDRYQEISGELEVSNVFRIRRTKRSSRHRQGQAFDINADENPLISNKELFELIALATGTEMDHERLSVDQVYDAQDAFKKNILDRGITQEVLTDGLRDLADYMNNEENYDLSELGGNSVEMDLNNSLNDLRSLLGNNPQDESALQQEIDKTIASILLVESKVEAAKGLVSSLDNGLLAQDRSPDATSQLKDYLNNITDNIDNIRSLVQNLSITSDTQQVLNELDANTTDQEVGLVGDLESYVDQWSTRFGDFESYAQKLDKLLNEGGKDKDGNPTRLNAIYGGAIFEHGFLNLPRDFVEAMVEVDFLSWGGNWKSPKDFMHFEIKTHDVKRVFKIKESVIDNFINK